MSVSHGVPAHTLAVRCAAIPRHLGTPGLARACFPLVLMRIGTQYPANVREYAHPGADSVVGGGYLPEALGRIPKQQKHSNVVRLNHAHADSNSAEFKGSSFDHSGNGYVRGNAP